MSTLKQCACSLYRYLFMQITLFLVPNCCLGFFFFVVGGVAVDLHDWAHRHTEIGLQQFCNTVLQHYTSCSAISCKPEIRESC